MRSLIEDKDTLEKMIDANTLTWVLNALTDICYEKAEHLRTNWQDKISALPWEVAAQNIDKLKTEGL